MAGAVMQEAGSFRFRLLAVARDGFEPPQTEPKSVVLPLDDRAKTSCLFRTGAQK